MPPKLAAQKEHNVYLTTSVTFDNKKDDFGRLQVYQAFASLDEANEFCEAKADELAVVLGVECPDPTLENYGRDGAFRMELPLEHRNRDMIVETVIMPLMGGTISHNKTVSRKTAAKPTKAIKTKPQKRRTNVKKGQSSDEEEEDYVSSNEMKDEPPSPKTKPTKPRKAIKAEDSDLDSTAARSENLDVVHRDSVVDSSAVTAADIAAAPSGSPDCLQYGSYFVVGHHEHWSEEQIKVIIKTFGGTLRDKMPVYNTDNTFSVVLGYKAPGVALRRIRQKEFQTYPPKVILARIGGPEGPTKITKEEVAKLCKQAPSKPKEETDSEEEL